MRLHRQDIARPRIKLGARLVSLRIDKVDARETMATERLARFSAGVTGDPASCRLFFLGFDRRIGPFRRVIHRDLEHRVTLLEF